MNPLLHDVRYALRQLRRNPGFTAVAILTLALGIGANTAIFSVVNAVLLRPLGYEDAGRLVEILPRGAGEAAPSSQLSFPNFRDLRQRSRSFTELAAFRFWIFTLSGSGEAESYLGVYASPELLPALRARLLLGHGLPPGSEHPGDRVEVILSHAAWKARYAGDSRIVGTAISLDGHPAIVAGVLAPEFSFPGLAPADAPLPSREPDVYVPIGLDGDGRDSRGSDNYWVLGRLSPGVSEAQARGEVGRIGRQLAGEYPDHNTHFALDLAPLQQEVVGETRAPLLILLGAVGLVLLIACTNVTGLLVARAATRNREMALRAALGASQARLARQLLTESVLLGLLGGGLGLLFALWGVQLIRAAAPNSLPRIAEASIDGRMLGFTLAVSVLTGLVFGLSPATQGAPPSEALKEGGRGSSGGGRRRLRSGLVVAEVALALILLAGAGLLLRSFVQLLRVDPGFDGGNVVTMLAILPPSRYPDSESRRGFVRTAVQRARTVPGVQSAGVVNTLPLSNLGGNTSFQVVGRPDPSEGPPSVPYRTVAGSYFDAMGIRLVAGRGFASGDGPAAPLVAVLSEAAVRRFFPGEEALGRRIQLGNDPSPRTVVGVARDIREEGLDRPAVAEVYYPFDQGPDPVFTLVARTAGEPLSFVPQIRRELAAIDPEQSVFLVRTMAELQASTLERRRFQLGILAAFAAAALALAAIGLYGVVSYSVTQRTREIGIRMALGAGRGAILGMLLREGLTLALAGAAVGLLGAWGLTRVLASQLFNVGTLDPVALGSVAVLLLAVAAVATLIPARRAARVDPMIALRAE